MRRIHIFKPGRHTDSGGTTLDFSAEALAAAALAYNPTLHEAPLVAGHPRHDLPAYGWVQRLEVDEDGLHAIPAQVDAQFEEIVEAGRYKHISASFYLPDAPSNPTPGTLYLRHVGFLGAQPPAVKGLKHIEFSGSEEGVASFEDALPLGLFARIFRGVRDAFVAGVGLEAADRIISPWDVAEVERLAGVQQATPSLRYDEGSGEGAPSADTPAPDAPTANEPAPAEDDAVPGADDPAEADGAALRAADLDAREADLVARESAAAEQAAQADAQRAEAESARQQAEADAARRRDAEAAAQARLDAAASFAEPLVASGQLLPRERAAVVQTLAALDAAGATVSFGEGDDAEDVGVAETLRGLLARLPQQVDYAERGAASHNANGETTSVEFAAPAGFTVDPSRAVLHGRAVAYQSAHPGTAYLDAVKAVS